MCHSRCDGAIDLRPATPQNWRSTIVNSRLWATIGCHMIPHTVGFPSNEDDDDDDEEDKEDEDPIMLLDT